MRTNKTLASIILALSFPTLYCMWVKNIKNTWVSTKPKIDRQRNT